MSSNFGEVIKVSIFGQSHSEAIGVVIDGLPAGEEIDLERVQAFLNRRAPGQNAYSTTRKEADQIRVLSGYYEGKTVGAPFCAMIENTNTRSKDYDKLKDVPRPAHADFTADVKYGGFADHRGGGHFSGRLTAPLCIAGAICIQILERKNIHIGGHIRSIFDVEEVGFDAVTVSKADFEAVLQQEFPTIDPRKGEEMKEAIAKAKANLDSVGGIVECCAVGLPVGIGEPMFLGLESKISSILFGIPAVKGISFGAGFDVARMYGSEQNDAYYIDEDGTIKTKTNNHGGSLGGISSGMPLMVEVAFKPTPSISQAQESVSLSERKNTTLEIVGRHDPCIVPRALPCVEAGLAVALLDLYYLGQKDKMENR